MIGCVFLAGVNKMKQYGSKKKRRRAEYLDRGAKRKREQTRADRIKNAKTMKEMADAMGIPLQ